VEGVGLRTGAPQARLRTRSYSFWLGAIAVAGAALRVAQTLLVAPWPPGIFNDEAYYSTLGHLIAHGHGFIRPAEFYAHGLSIPTAERAPLFSILLAGLDKIGLDGGDGRLLGVVSGGAAIVAVGLLGRRVAGDRAGLIAAGVAAVYPVLIAADGALMTESLYGALAAFAMLVAYRLVERPSLREALLLGVLVGLAALSRGEGLLLLPLLLVPLVRRPAGLRSAAVVVLAFAAVLAPWTVRNWIDFDRPVLVATEGGETLAGANCDQAYHGDRIGTWVFTCVHFSGTGNEAAELNAEGKKGLRYARHHLGRLPLVATVRVARTWGAWAPFATPEGRRAWVMDIGVWVYFALIPLAVYGFVLLRRRRVPVWILVAPVISATLTALLSYGSIRFRHSAELTLVVLAAVAIDRLISAPERRGERWSNRMIAGDGPDRPSH
jgi:4-amino-4-deoxy-L-arabinose transferase-like glycosyltransferase